MLWYKNGFGLFFVGFGWFFFFQNSGSTSSSLPHILVLTSCLSNPKNSALQSEAYLETANAFMQHPVPLSVLFLVHMQLVFNQNNKFLNDDIWF